MDVFFDTSQYHNVTGHFISVITLLTLLIILAYQKFQRVSTDSSVSHELVRVSNFAHTHKCTRAHTHRHKHLHNQTIYIKEFGSEEFFFNCTPHIAQQFCHPSQRWRGT